jgi:uncharacterized protein (DUF2225 family)
MTLEYQVILGITIVLNTAAILFLGHLISFHLQLQSKKMTTFEYIQWQQNRRNHKSKIFRQVNEGNNNKQDLTEEEVAEVKANTDDDHLKTAGAIIKSSGDDME